MCLLTTLSNFGGKNGVLFRLAFDCLDAESGDSQHLPDAGAIGNDGEGNKSVCEAELGHPEELQSFIGLRLLMSLQP